MKNTGTDSRLVFLSIGSIIGLTYTVDLRWAGIDFTTTDFKAKFVVMLIFIILFLYLHSVAVKETFISDSD